MKKGCIKIQRHTYENDWHIVGQLFQQFKPFHIGFDGEKDQWIFTGTCDSFDEVVEHLPAPQYLVTIKANPEACTGNAANGLHVSFQRAEPPKDTGLGLLLLAMQILKDELKKDQSEGSLYHGWKQQLSRIIEREFWWTIGITNYSNKTYSANTSAEIFLNNLINGK